MHLPDLIKNYKFKGSDTSSKFTDDILLGVTKIPWFEVCNRLTAFIDHFIKLAEKQKVEHNCERREMREKLKQREEHIQALQKDIESLKKFNSTPLHQQYKAVADEKAKLTEENDKLQYNLGEIEKEKREIDTIVYKLKQENQACKEEYDMI